MNKKIIAIMAVMTVTLSMAGCGNKDENLSKADKSTSSVSSESEVQTVNESESASEKINKNESARPESEMVLPKGKFDFDKAIDNFYLYGEKVDLPFTMDSLSDTFVLGDLIQGTDEKGEFNNSTEGHLFYKEKEEFGTGIASVYFNNVMPQDFDGTYSCYHLLVHKDADYNIYGIKSGMTFDEVKKLWGAPTKEGKGDILYGDESKYIWFYLGTDKNTIKDMQISIK